jgi:hypothetical protein
MPVSSSTLPAPPLQPSWRIRAMRTRSKQPWITLPDGDRQFETQPDDIAGFLGGASPSGAT